MSKVREKLLHQIEEAKKIKSNNRNLRESVQYMNQVAISRGIIKPVACLYCDKSFRDSSFLQTHVDRKHPGKPVGRVSTSTPVKKTAESKDNSAHLLLQNGDISAIEIEGKEAIRKIDSSTNTRATKIEYQESMNVSPSKLLISETNLNETYTNANKTETTETKLLDVTSTVKNNEVSDKRRK